MERIRKAAWWLLCLVMFASAVAFAGEKVTSGKIAPDIETLQQNPFLTDCLHREKSPSPTGCTSDLVKPIFDKEKEQNRLKEAQLIGEIGTQAMDIARTQGKIIATKAANDKMATANDADRQTAKAQWEKANPGETPTDKQVNEQVYSNFYNQAFSASGYGTGGKVQQALQAATAAVQGLAGGDLAKAIAGGSAPYLAEVIKQVSPDEASRVMAHAVVAGVLAAAQGNSAAAGAAGAATTALMGEAIKNALYGDIPVSELSESQKQTLVALGTAAAGLAGGLTGDSSADAMTGAQAGQNEISNNMTSIGAIQQMQAWALMNSAAAAEAGSVNPNDQAALALTKAAKQGLSAACLANTSCVMMAIVSAQSQSDADKSSTPNIGKDLTDADKAELGGTGSGTPGGWGPEDEEKARTGETGQKPTTGEKIGKWSVDELSNGAKQMDPASKKGDLTLAGRALQKHGSREGSAFPSAKGNPSAINEQGQKIVDSILNDPNKSFIQSNTGRYGQVTDVMSSSGRGLRYDAQGKLIGFLEPPK